MKNGDTYKKRAVAIILLAACVLSIVPIIMNLFVNFPYYNYIDEGHILLWTESFYKEEAPLRIFYGPLQFYLITFFDALYYIVSNFSVTGLWSYLSNHSDPQFYNDFRSTNVLVIGRLISFASIIIATYFIYIVGRNISKDKIYGIVTALFFITQLWVQEIATYVQPEILSLAILSSILAYLTCLDENGDVKYRGKFVENVFLGFMFALLASTKIYLVLFSILPIIVIYSRRGLFIAIIKSTTLYASLIFFVFLIYYPYRDPVELYEMFKFAASYYDNKENNEPLLFSLIHQKNLDYSQYFLMFMLPFLLFRFKLSIVSKSLIFIFMVCFLYFSLYKFSNTRNLIVFNIVTAVVFVEMFVVWRDLLPVRMANQVFVLVSFLLVSSNAYALLNFFDRGGASFDSRNSGEVKELLSSNIPLLIDSRLQIYSNDSSHITYIDDMNAVAMKYTGKVYMLSARSLSANKFSLCHLKTEVGNKVANNKFFFIKDPKIYIYGCQF